MSAEPKNYYEILGVSRNATLEEIQFAYRRLASEYHPDHGGSDKQMQEINEARDVLTDTERRKEHDRSLSSEFTTNAKTETKKDTTWEEAISAHSNGEEIAHPEQWSEQLASSLRQASSALELMPLLSFWEKYSTRIRMRGEASNLACEAIKVILGADILQSIKVKDALDKLSFLVSVLEYDTEARFTEQEKFSFGTSCAKILQTNAQISMRDKLSLHRMLKRTLHASFESALKYYFEVNPLITGDDSRCNVFA